MDHPGSKFTHSICDDCWKKREPGRKPARTMDVDNHPCCFCGVAHDSGIYVRENPKNTKCSATLRKKKRKIAAPEKGLERKTGMAMGLVKASLASKGIGANSYAAWYKRAIAGMSESLAIILIVPADGSVGDDKLRAEISAAVYLQKPTYLLMPKNGDIPAALQAAGLIKGVVGYDRKIRGDFDRATRELMQLMEQAIQEDGNETNDVG